jgi:hypothetical protein
MAKMARLQCRCMLKIDGFLASSSVWLVVDQYEATHTSTVAVPFSWRETTPFPPAVRYKYFWSSANE